ncbi:anti-repressor SinI family protein [Oceanobacillus sp. CF4.6]|uniref:anti-repressor SinI family protein n=1 Tax=Oceanobacillus sp. CF4.6 TaxID=3373080 RepID=UPI003EE4EAB5
MHSRQSVDIAKLDQEWLQLIWEARKLDLSIEEVRNFLQQKNKSTFILHRNPEVNDTRTKT